MDKQKKICRWLKGLVILLAIIGFIFFAAVTVLAFRLRDQGQSGLLWTYVFFSWYTAALCYGVLLQFWKVCTEIGRDNSFSMENVRSFHRMACLGIASGTGYLIRMVYLCFVTSFLWQNICWGLCLFFLSVVFTGLCEALSQLIKNAYEVKRENELTI